MARAATVKTWAERVTRWEQSGQTAKVFATKEGVSAQSLSWWKCKLGQSRGIQPSSNEECSSPSIAAALLWRLFPPGPRVRPNQETGSAVLACVPHTPCSPDRPIPPSAPRSSCSRCGGPLPVTRSGKVKHRTRYCSAQCRTSDVRDRWAQPRTDLQQLEVRIYTALALMGVLGEVVTAFTDIGAPAVVRSVADEPRSLDMRTAIEKRSTPCWPPPSRSCPSG